MKPTPWGSGRRWLPAVVALGLGLGLAPVPSVSGAGDRENREEEVAESSIPRQVDDAETVDVHRAHALWQRGVPFVDVRSAEKWGRGHIPGAIHLDSESAFNEENLQRVAAPGQEVVIYCDKGVRSSVMVETAVFWDYTRLRYFRDGMNAWRAAGFPEER